MGSAPYNRDYYLANRERLLAKQKEYAKANKEKIREYKKKYYLKNKEKYSYKNRNEDPEKRRARIRKWKKTKKGRICVTKYNHRRRNRKQNNGPAIIPPTLEFIEMLLEGKCELCDNKAQTIDHWIPLSKNGVHGAENMVGMCESCNYSKQDKLIGVDNDKEKERERSTRRGYSFP